MDDPKWLAAARAYLGQAEVKGAKHNPVILRWWTLIRAPFTDDETPWCAAFVGGVLEECGYKSTRSAAARSYSNYGVELNKPAYGCIVVLWRGRPDGPFGHVGYLVGKDQKGNLMILGGNQGDMVSIRPFSPERVIAFRWPGIRPHVHRYNLPLLESDGKVSTNER
jgi:uncharacterized protein (TIGR02594 family)